MKNARKWRDITEPERLMTLPTRKSFSAKRVAAVTEVSVIITSFLEGLHQSKRSLSTTTTAAAAIATTTFATFVQKVLIDEPLTRLRSVPPLWANEKVPSM
jgi:hypothetical protein